MTVKVCGVPEYPTSTFPKLRDETEASTSATPTPERVAVNVLSEELFETTLMVPVRVPRAVGVKVTETVQLVFAAMLPEQVVADTAKLPVVRTFEMVRAMALVFVQVKVWAAEVTPTTVVG